MELPPIIGAVQTIGKASGPAPTLISALVGVVSAPSRQKTIQQNAARCPSYRFWRSRVAQITKTY